MMHQSKTSGPQVVLQPSHIPREHTPFSSSRLYPHKRSRALTPSPRPQTA